MERPIKAYRWPVLYATWKITQNSSDIHKTRYSVYSPVCAAEIGRRGERVTGRWRCTVGFIQSSRMMYCELLQGWVYYIFSALNEYRWAAGNINGTVAVFSVITLPSSSSSSLSSLFTLSPWSSFYGSPVFPSLSLSFCPSSPSFTQRSSFVSAKTLLKSFIKCHKLLRSAGGRRAAG